jgi:hypothetical protein
MLLKVRTMSPPLLQPCCVTRDPSCDASKFSIWNEVNEMHGPLHTSMPQSSKHKKYAAFNLQQVLLCNGPKGLGNK